MSTFIEADAEKPSQAAQLARLHKSAVSRRRQHSSDDEGDVEDDDIFDELERELEEEDERGNGVMGRLREERMAALRAEIRQEEARRNAPKGSGHLTEPTNEKELMQILGDRAGDLAGGDGTPVVVHFYHKEFRRCDIMNQHLQIIAAQHPETLFVKMSVLAATFLVEKLQIKVLPCLITFGKRAQVKDVIVGFEDLGNSDGFTTQTLEWRLAQKGAIQSRTDKSSRSNNSIMGFATDSIQSHNDDDDLDWD